MAFLKHRNIALSIITLGMTKPDTHRLNTYETKLRDELGLKKKLKWFDWIAIDDHISHLGNSKFDVFLNGSLIPPSKVKKEINRNLKRRSSTTGISARDDSIDEN
jgi:hypothetical protein